MLPTTKKENTEEDKKKVNSSIYCRYLLKANIPLIAVNVLYFCKGKDLEIRNNISISRPAPRIDIEPPMLVPISNNNGPNHMFPFLGNTVRQNLIQAPLPFSGQFGFAANPNNSLMLNMSRVPLQTSIDNTPRTNFPVGPQQLILIVHNSNQNINTTNTVVQLQAPSLCLIEKHPTSNLEQTLQRQITSETERSLAPPLKPTNIVPSTLNITNMQSKNNVAKLQQSTQTTVSNTVSVNIDQAIVAPKGAPISRIITNKNIPTKGQAKKCEAENMSKVQQMTTNSKQTSIAQLGIKTITSLDKKNIATKTSSSVAQTNINNVEIPNTPNMTSQIKTQDSTNMPEHSESSTSRITSTNSKCSNIIKREVHIPCFRWQTVPVVNDNHLPPGYTHPFNYSYMINSKSVNYLDIFIKTFPSETIEEDEGNDDEDNGTSDFALWKCLYCFQNQPTKLALLKHYVDHKNKNDSISMENTEEEFIECRACYAKFATLQKYAKHVEKHKTDYSKDFYCDICENRFDDVRSLVTHSYEEHTKPYWYQCPLCKTFTCKHHQTIFAHIAQKHETSKESHFCSECKRTFTCLNWYNNHQLFHVKKPYECTICTKNFIFNRELSRHNQKLHAYKYGSVFVKHECKMCSMKFATHLSLKIHNLIHKEEKESYLCNVCGKTFRRQYNLSAHAKTHSTVKKFVCNTCDKTFTKRENLVTHIRTHTGEKPYKCNVCSKAFAQRTPLRVHVRSHTGERPYKCLRCDRGFCSKGACDSHKKTCKN